MKIKVLLAKVLKGEELSDAEKKFLQEYNEPKHDDSKEKELAQQLAEAQQKIDDAENDKLSEVEKLQKENEKLKKENDDVKAAKTAQDFDLAVSKLASKHKFTDPEYLKYLVGKDKVDLEKDGESFMDNLKKDKPKYFTAEVNKGGGGSGNEKTPEDKTKTQEAELNELLGKDNLTKREASRVIELQTEIDNNQNKE
jgi:hypothetical protein